MGRIGFGELRHGKAHVLLARHRQRDCLSVSGRIHQLTERLLLLLGRLHLLLLPEELLLHLLLLLHHLLALLFHLLLLRFLVHGGYEGVDALELPDVEVI